MSKIFEALYRAKGNATEVLGAALTEQLNSSPPDVSAVDHDTEPAEALSGSTGEALREAPIRAISFRAPQAGSPIFPFDTVHRSAAEQYRMIRTRIVQSLEPRRVIMVSSPDSGDGKTISTINIAGALALKTDVNVLILDADLCHPAVARTLGIPASPGLAEVLSGNTPLRDAVVRLEPYPNLYVLPAGEVHSTRTELLDSPRWKAVCSATRSQFLFTMVDAPPIDAVADYPLIQAACDGVIVIVRPDHTNRARCAHALETVPVEKRMGVVINAAEDWFLLRNSPYHYYGSGYYNSYYSEGSEGNGKKPK